jgi:hypothetical protein
MVRLRRGSSDPSIGRRVGALLTDPAFDTLVARVNGRYGDLEQLERALLELSSPVGGLQEGEIDLHRAMAVLSANGVSTGALEKALIGLLAVATLEGLARRYGPPTEYPGIAIRSIETVGLPAARWLQEAGAYTGAATLAGLLRQYMISDPAQRALPAGRRAIAACREVEAARARHLTECCRHTAWQLRSRAEEDVTTRRCLAALYFALGDALRARGIAERRHTPSLPAVLDLVRVSVELAPLDPLLQAIWLVTLGEAKPDVPDDLRFLLRAIIPEINAPFKDADAAAKKVLGMSYSQAYAEGVLSYVSGAWDGDTTSSHWWSVLIEAMKLPPAQHEYRSGFVRLLELYSLAFEPGETLPNSGSVAAFAGSDPIDRTDLREVATLSLRLDGWTSQRGQLGRSLAYDSGFLIEPWRRNETAMRAIELLEAHRHASLQYWLTVVPPLTEEPSKRRRRALAAEDRDLAHEYRSLAYLATLEEAPFYTRVYGESQSRRVIHASESDRLRRLIACDERQEQWRTRALRAWPEYAAERTPAPARLTEVGQLLGIG